MDRVSSQLMLKSGPINDRVDEAMRGDDIHQNSMFSYLSPEARVPKDHPLRPLRQMVNQALAELSRDFQAMYSSEGGPSIPPEKLLRALLLQVLYTIRSERLLTEQLDYNLFYRWFVGLSVDEAVWVGAPHMMRMLLGFSSGGAGAGGAGGSSILGAGFSGTASGSGEGAGAGSSEGWGAGGSAASAGLGARGTTVSGLAGVGRLAAPGGVSSGVGVIGASGPVSGGTVTRVLER
jgi:hypothetical protein